MQTIMSFRRMREEGETGTVEKLAWAIQNKISNTGLRRCDEYFFRG